MDRDSIRTLFSFFFFTNIARNQYSALLLHKIQYIFTSTLNMHASCKQHIETQIHLTVAACTHTHTHIRDTNTNSTYTYFTFSWVFDVDRIGSSFWILHSTWIKKFVIIQSENSFSFAIRRYFHLLSIHKNFRNFK